MKFDSNFATWGENREIFHETWPYLGLVCLSRATIGSCANQEKYCRWKAKYTEHASIKPNIVEKQSLVIISLMACVYGFYTYKC